ETIGAHIVRSPKRGGLPGRPCAHLARSVVTRSGGCRQLHYAAQQCSYRTCAVHDEKNNIISVLASLSILPHRSCYALYLLQMLLDRIHRDIIPDQWANASHL